MSSQRRLIVSAVAGAGLALSLGLGSAAADPETPTPTSPTQAAGTPGLQLTGGAAGGTPTVPGRQATGAQAPSYAYVLDRLSSEFTRGSSAGQVANLLNEALTAERPQLWNEAEEQWDAAVSAQGLLAAARLLAQRYHLVITN
ncbi:MAG TPA: hypothetical protein PKI77_09430, partial [Mycobacterium sp.]|nr:hypothetical protein [Mycobacterium sp.]